VKKYRVKKIIVGTPTINGYAVSSLATGWADSMKRIRRAASPEFCWLLSEMRPVWRLQMLSLVCIVAASMLTIAGPLLLRWLIDDVLKAQRVTLLLAGTSVYGITLLGQLAFNYSGFLLSGWAVEKLTFSIRMRRLRKLHNVSAAYHDHTPTGEIQYRLEQDVDRVGEFGADILPSLLRMLATGMMVLTTMAVLNLRMTLLVLPLLPLFYFLQRKYFAELRAKADCALERTGATSALLQEHLLGLIQLQLLNRTGFHGRKLARLAAEGAQARMQQRFAQIRFSASSMLVVVVGSAGILAYGGHEVIDGALTVGGLVAFYAYVAQLFGPLSTAVDLQSRIQRVGASIRRILEIGEEAKHEIIAFPSTMCPARPSFRARTASLEFNSVSFSHGKSRLVLKDLNLIVDEGEKVAMVGHSGCGKSTMVHLAAGLYSPDIGIIRVQGRDIAALGRRELRSLVALVPQDPVLFAGTLRDNLLYGNPQATSSDLELATELAQLEDLLLRLSAGFEESLGPLGRKLSGGEKKRIALARALLQQPRILILDEVTGALDGFTSTLLMERLEEYRKDRTVLLVSHKPATIAWANRIVVLEQGRVVANGSHTELIQQCGTYQKLCANEAEAN